LNLATGIELVSIFGNGREESSEAYVRKAFFTSSRARTRRMLMWKELSQD